MKRHIPQFITLLNLLCGCIATVFAALNKLEWAAFFVFLGIVFDFFDGFAARLLDAQSELGVQLDSLADMVTSGVVPGVVMFQLLAMSQTGGWNLDMGNVSADSAHHVISISLLPFFGFLITLASAYRLAKFNIDEDQVNTFTGLPTPANALLILSLPLILLNQGNDYINAILLNPWFLIALTVLSSYLLNANIPLFALKFKNWSFKENAHRYIFLIVSLVLLLTLSYLAIPGIVLFYILGSVVYNIGAKDKSQGL
ncbi:CDP-alcohol phosphatidyltransferase family protein [Eudoraea sp.]|uniref:CDP-alcohol phosphatidyltransferase family protein n=1 Tax=Eudoraea sp. TaxID=1979955 RepID=UPI003C74A58C